MTINNADVLLLLIIGCYVQVFGQGKSQWTKQVGRHTVTYTGIENFIHSRSYLFGEYGGPTFELAAGVHQYKFSCQLPYQLPYSLKLVYGTISYHVEACLDIPWKAEKEAKVYFTVLRYDDLNFYPELKTAITCIETKNFLSLFNDSNNLHMSVTIPCRGFAVNHYAPVIINYENKSSVDIIGTKIKLLRITILNSPLQSKNKVLDDVVGQARFEGVSANSSKIIQASLKIPKVMTSNEKFCQVIIIKYLIEIEAEASGMRSNAKVRLPITIGTVPLQFENQFEAPQMMQPSVALPQTHNSGLSNICSFITV